MSVFVDTSALYALLVKTEDGRKEVSEAFEVGIKTEWLDRRLQINAAVFRTDIEDNQFFEFFAGPFGLLRVVTTIDEAEVLGAVDKLKKTIVRGRILAGEPRIDVRDTRTVRPITVRTGVLPRTHGSALLTRGEKQALVVTTLGSERDSQIIDALEGESWKSFMLHYNFPPFSVGEVGFFRGAGRREIGHGALAERSLEPLSCIMVDLDYFKMVNDTLGHPAGDEVLREFAMLVTGVGGTGVVTISSVLGQAAHIEGKGFGAIDMTGLAQKGGAVACHLKFADRAEDIKAIRVGWQTAML